MNVEVANKLTHAWGADDVARNGTSPHGGACRSVSACGRLRISEELWSQRQKRRKTNMSTEAIIQHKKAVLCKGAIPKINKINIILIKKLSFYILKFY